MPNIIKGDMRLRGTKKDLLKYLHEGFDGSLMNGVFRGEADFDDIESNIEFLNCEEEYKKTSIYLRVEFAWDVKAEQIQELAVKYNIDIKMYLYENGMCFNRDIMIIDGCIFRDNTIRYEDYIWECTNPSIGG